MPESRSRPTGAKDRAAAEVERPWQLPRGRHGLSRETVVRSQRERLVAAMVRVSAAKGYSSTAVADVLEVSGVGRASFYELFDDKEDCFLAAHRMLVDDLFHHTKAAFGPSGPWPERVRKALTALVDWFAADPDVARVTLVEITGIGPGVRKLFGEDLGRFGSLLGEGHDPIDGVPNVGGIAGSVIFARLYEEVVLGRAAALPRLLPRLTYEVLLPFLGEEAARAQERKAREGA